MIKFRVRELAKLKSIKNAYQLQMAMMRQGIVCSSVKSYRIWNADAEATTFNRTTLDELCEVLDCQPGDLLVRVRDRK